MHKVDATFAFIGFPGRIRREIQWQLRHSAVHGTGFIDIFDCRADIALTQHYFRIVQIRTSQAQNYIMIVQATTHRKPGASNGSSGRFPVS